MSFMADIGDRLEQALASTVHGERSSEGKLFRLLIDAVRDQGHRIEELEGQIAHLREDVDKLEEQ
jgi:hypothetical protein